MKCYKYEGNSTFWQGTSFIIFADDLNEAKKIFKDSFPDEDFLESDEHWIEIEITKHAEMFSDWIDL